VAKPHQKAPIYIINGAGGNREGNENPGGDAPWSAPGAHSGAFAFGVLEVTSSPNPGSSSLYYALHDSNTGIVIDEVRVQK